MFLVGWHMYHVGWSEMLLVTWYTDRGHRVTVFHVAWHMFRVAWSMVLLVGWNKLLVTWDNDRSFIPPTSGLCTCAGEPYLGGADVSRAA